MYKRVGGIPCDKVHALVCELRDVTGLSMNGLAKASGVAYSAINRISHKRVGIVHNATYDKLVDCLRHYCSGDEFN